MADSNTYREGTEVNSREWLKELLQEKCHFHEVRDFQLQHGLDLINGRDLFLVIAPGMGKTTVLLAPLLAAQARGETGIGLLVVPTKLLAEQTARVASSRGLRALAINEDTLHEESNRGRNLFTELGTGEDIRLGVMSPYMLGGTRMDEFLKNEERRKLVRWMFGLLMRCTFSTRIAPIGVRHMALST